LKKEKGDGSREEEKNQRIEKGKKGNLAVGREDKRGRWEKKRAIYFGNHEHEGVVKRED